MNIRSFSLLILCTVIFTSSCSLEKRRYSRGFTFSRHHVPQTAKNRAVKMPVKVGLETAHLNEHCTHVMNADAITHKKATVRATPSTVRHATATRGAKITSELAAVNRLRHPELIKHKEYSSAKSAGEEKNKTKVVGVLFLFIMAILMACLAFIFYALLGIFGIIFLIIFGIAAVILAIAGLITSLVQ